MRHSRSDSASRRGQKIENDSAALLLGLPCVDELESQLCLADPRRPHDNGQRAGQQAAAQQRVQAGDSRR